MVALFLEGRKGGRHDHLSTNPGGQSVVGLVPVAVADKAIVSLNAVAGLETGIVDSRISTVQAVQKALVKAGIEFLDADQKRRRGEASRTRNSNQHRGPLQTQPSCPRETVQRSRLANARTLLSRTNP